MIDDRASLFQRLRSESHDRDLTPDETNEVLRELDDSNSPIDKVLLLLILRETPTPQHAAHIEPFLGSPNAFVTSDALKVLCNWWGLCESYQPQILKFLDSDVNDVRVSAMSVAARCFKKHGHRVLLEKLLSIATDETEDDSDRGWGLFCVGKALGDHWANTSGFSLEILTETGLIASVLQRARERLTSTPDLS